VAQTVDTSDWHTLFSSVTGIPDDTRLVPPAMAMLAATAFEALARIQGRPAPFNRNAVRHVRQGQHYECARVRHELKITFRPLASTLRDAVRWYAENGWITDEARLAIVNSALRRAADDLRPRTLSASQAWRSG
jgi:hypothetical protein